GSRAAAGAAARRRPGRGPGSRPDGDRPGRRRRPRPRGARAAGRRAAAAADGLGGPRALSRTRRAPGAPRRRPRGRARRWPAGRCRRDCFRHRDRSGRRFAAPAGQPACGRGRGACACQGARAASMSATPRPARPAARKTRARRSRLSKAEIHELFSRLAELDPEPTTELEYSTPFELLVAVVLSAQATDVGVNKATRRLFPVANTPQAILDLGEDVLRRHISTIGLFNAKAKNVMALCRILVEQHGGEVPRTREQLEALPGV